MADNHHGGPAPLHSEARAAPVTPERYTRSSYETGESSTAGSLPQAASSSGGSNGGVVSSSGRFDLNSSPAGQRLHEDEHEAHNGRLRRRSKLRSGGGFLLQDAVAGDREHSTRRRARSMVQHKGKAPPKTPERTKPSSNHGSASKDYSALASGRSKAVSSTHPPQADGEMAYAEDHAKGHTDSSPASSASHDRDVDSTQIVNMALNLSESRRSASRRHASRSNPPQLAPLPESSSRSNLRQHFQQQRKNSRTLSPKPGQHSSPRIPSGFRANSPLQNSIEGQDGRFRYQFSASTLARAQKAKDHLELLAEYRRLLEYLPPLKSSQDHHLLGSPPGSPPLGPRGTKSRVQSTMLKTGRPYNPLQYVRNRKVRARERKVIDGEQMGFSDVRSVKSWVDRLAEPSYAAFANQGNAGFAMPEFPGAHDENPDGSPDSTAKQSQRVKRPRVDWFFDPCDMVADAYWLEQDHHKQLIEDRHWRKIFPPPPSTSRPISRQVDDLDHNDNLAFIKTNVDTADTSELQDVRLIHTDDGAHGGTRERAKQKLHDMRGFHHRHSSSVHGSEFLRTRRESFSDASGNEAETRPERRGRRDTITSDANDLLQRQMRDIIAQEAREKELENVPETEAEHHTPSEPRSPEKNTSTQPNSRTHSRKASVVDWNDFDSRLNAYRGRVESPPRYRRGRPSLEIPEDRRRPSISDWYQSVPSSPKAEIKDPIALSQAGFNLSMPSSRSGSPTRNPLSKVKRRFRDRSREAGVDILSEDEHDLKQQASFPEPTPPLEKITSRPTDESHKSHRSTGSMRLRDDQAVGLRGLFKGPRIDTVIRGGVSKLGDMLWRRENDGSSADEATDESEAELDRGRSRQSLDMSRRPSNQSKDETPLNAKHFFDEMPEFRHMNEAPGKPSDTQNQLLNAPDISRPPSRQSARWEKLKPPRIDVKSASPTSSPNILPVGSGQGEASESGSYPQSVPDGVRAADHRLNDIVNGRQLDRKSRSQSRHWSITDTAQAPDRNRLSKREIIRMRALILSSGIKAMEIKRRAAAPQQPFYKDALNGPREDPSGASCGVDWADLAKLAPDNQDLPGQEVPTCEVYHLASRVLGMAIQSSGQRWQASADKFTSTTSPGLQKQIWEIRSRLTDDLSNMTRRAADEADETNKELALDQPLKIKHVNDVIEKLLRNRRRRFRWVRRGLWLTVEWLLVGFMWYVWFMVMVVRLFLGIGKGLVSGVRWLFWL